MEIWFILCPMIVAGAIGIAATLNASTNIRANVLNRAVHMCVKYAGQISAITFLGLALLSLHSALIDPNIFANCSYEAMYFEAIDYKLGLGLLSFNLQDGILLRHLHFNKMTYVMTSLVSVISCLVSWYSVSYISREQKLVSNTAFFFLYLNVFAAGMILFVLSTNLIQLFVGWELMGLMSYLMVKFWDVEIKNCRSGLFVLLLNKIGDACLLGGIMLAIFAQGDISIFSLFKLNVMTDTTLVGSQNYINMCAILILIAALCKSAQGIFYIWLPRAMSGPTPASALMHSATMVTAGGILLLKADHGLLLLEILQDITVGNCISVIGAITTIYTSCLAAFENNIKKIAAYSSCSQLGYMFVAIGTRNPDACLYHLINHAFFKCNIFLAIGVLIHKTGTQDIRDMKYSYNKDLTTLCSFIGVALGSASLIGLPFMPAFYSKQAIMLGVHNEWLHWILTMSIIPTTMYAAKIILIPFRYVNSSCDVLPKEQNNQISEYMPIIILCVLTIGSSWLAAALGYSNTISEDVINTRSESISYACKAIGMILGIAAYYANDMYKHKGFFASTQAAVDIVEKDAISAGITMVAKKIYIAFAYIADCIDTMFEIVIIQFPTSAILTIGQYAKGASPRLISSYNLIYVFTLCAIVSLGFWLI